MSKNFFYYSVCLILVTSVLSNEIEKDVIDKYHKYCKGIKYLDIDNFKHNLNDYRKHRDNSYYDNYDEIITDLK